MDILPSASYSAEYYNINPISASEQTNFIYKASIKERHILNWESVKNYTCGDK
jgi:hypothetical protein